MKNYYPSENALIIYNVTIKVDSSVAAQWFQWLLKEHIPEVMDTACFTEYRVLKILDIDEDGLTYAIQYSAVTIEDYTRYLTSFADNLRKKSFDKWGDNFMAFRTLMEVCNRCAKKYSSPLYQFYSIFPLKALPCLYYRRYFFKALSSMLFSGLFVRCLQHSYNNNA